MYKSCADCGRLIPYGKPRCPACEEKFIIRSAAKAAKSKRERDRRYNQKRNPKYKKFYNSRDWKNLQADVVRAAEYKCQGCGRQLGSRMEDGRIVTLEVDHIVPLQEEEGWNMRLDRKNLRCLCSDCHNKKHNRFQPKTPRGR